MNMNMVLFAFVLACAVVYAAEDMVYPPGSGTARLELNKSAPLTAAIGDTITVRIEVRNRGVSAVSALVEEYLGNVEPVSPQPKYANISEEIYAAHPPYLSWVVNISPGSSQILEYTIKPKSVGPLSIGPTRAYAEGKAFSSNPLLIDVACTSSASCEENLGENPLTCPEKCAAPDATGETAPDFTPQPVPSAPIGLPDAKANMEEVNAEEKKYEDDKNNQVLMIGAVVVVVIAAAAWYFLIFRKKDGKKK